MRKIYFDEAGNSGNNLLDKEQPLFCYLGFEDCDSNTIEDFYEPYLLQVGLIERTPRGRRATPRAYTHLNQTPPQAD